MRLGIARTPNIGMAICKIQGEAIVMAVGRESREIIPYLGGWVGNKIAVTYAALILVDHHEHIRRTPYFSIFRKVRHELRRGNNGVRRLRFAPTHETVHRIAADRRICFTGVCSSSISGTTI